MSNPVPADGLDPAIIVPAAVRAQAARATQMMEPPAEAPAEEAPPAPAEQPAEQPAEAAAPKPPKPEQMPLPFDEPPAPKPETDVAKLQNQLNSALGRLRAKDDQVKGMQEEISRLHTMLAAIQASTPTTVVNVPAELQAGSLLTKEEREEYGEELLDVMAKRAQEAVAPVLNAYQAKIAELENRLSAVGQHTIQNERTKMLAMLDDRLPDWRTVNRSKEFVAWLGLPDPYSGVMRKELLKRAYDANDGSRVLRFFNGFLADEAATRPAGSEVPASAPTPGPAKTDLASLAAPGRAKSSQAPVSDEKPIVSRSEIAAFYAACAKGKYLGREAEKEKMERMYHAAAIEGRLR